MSLHMRHTCSIPRNADQLSADIAGGRASPSLLYVHARPLLAEEVEWQMYNISRRHTEMMRWRQSASSDFAAAAAAATDASVGVPSALLLAVLVAECRPYPACALNQVTHA